MEDGERGEVVGVERKGKVKVEVERRKGGWRHGCRCEDGRGNFETDREDDESAAKAGRQLRSTWSVHGQL
jgi:hypothetical protein